MQFVLHKFVVDTFECVLSNFSYRQLADLITRVRPCGEHSTERWCTTCAGNYFVLHQACRQPTENVSSIHDDKALMIGCYVMNLKL